MKVLSRLAIAAAIGMAALAPASATDVLKISTPGDRTDVLPAVTNTRLVTFRYSDDVSYLVRALTGAEVNIEVPDGEVIQGFYLSDPDSWEFHVTGDDRRVRVKPLLEGKVNTGTLVTDQRSYELTLASVPMGEMWFQRVRWQIPASHVATGRYWRGGTAAGAEGASVGDPQLNPSALNFQYRVKGKADFTPATVFDDGVRTWIRFDDVQDLPAIFARRGKELEVLDYSTQGPYVVIPSISPELVLRLRKQEVTVERRG